MDPESLSTVNLVAMKSDLRSSYVANFGDADSGLKFLHREVVEIHQAGIR